MAIEIERKYLVHLDQLELPAEYFRICQGYFATAGLVAIRVRIKNDLAYLCVKGPAENGLSRLEFEYPVPMQDAEDMLQTLVQRPFIEKHRYHVYHQGYCFEVDVFDGDNAGLVFAEIELQHEDEEPPLPRWIGEEITHDPRYFNSSLIKYPYKDWPENQA